MGVTAVDRAGHAIIKLKWCSGLADSRRTNLIAITEIGVRASGPVRYWRVLDTRDRIARIFRARIAVIYHEWCSGLADSCRTNLIAITKIGVRAPRARPVLACAGHPGPDRTNPPCTNCRHLPRVVFRTCHRMNRSRRSEHQGAVMTAGAKHHGSRNSSRSTYILARYLESQILGGQSRPFLRTNRRSSPRPPALLNANRGWSQDLQPRPRQESDRLCLDNSTFQPKRSPRHDHNLIVAAARKRSRILHSDKHIGTSGNHRLDRRQCMAGAITDYAIKVVATLDPDDPASLAAIKKALKPLDVVRERASHPGTPEETPEVPPVDPTTPVPEDT